MLCPGGYAMLDSWGRGSVSTTSGDNTERVEPGQESIRRELDCSVASEVWGDDPCVSA